MSRKSPSSYSRRPLVLGLVVFAVAALAAAGAVAMALVWDSSRARPVSVLPVTKAPALTVEEAVETTVEPPPPKPKPEPAGVPQKRTPAATTVRKPKAEVVAIQPSHQDDTGEGWHEYVVCGDIADRTIAAMRGVRGVKVWCTSRGLTGSNNYRPSPSNTVAFDVETRKANLAGAKYFVSIHNDAGAPSGILVETLPGDVRGAQFGAYLLARLTAATGLPSRGARDVRLYSLERSRARYRALIEVGDNTADREFLLSPASRARTASALAAALRSFAVAH